MSSSDYKNKNKPTKNSRYRQGYYRPENSEKYLGDVTKIIYRSTYEYKFCRFCDNSTDVLSWSSEPFSVKYYDPVKQKKRDYFIDFYMKYKRADTINDYLIEVKPKKKLVMPVFEGKQTLKRLKSYNSEVEEFLTNKSKIEAAKDYARSLGYKFIVVTEDFLYNNDLE